jgi:hypothetical protein
MKFFNTYLGVWSGKGISFGQELHGKLQIYTKCQGDFLVFEESLFEQDGSQQYEDCAWIHQQVPQQPSIEKPKYIGYHFTPGGNVQRFLLVIKEDTHGFHWWAGPLVPVVYYKIYEDNLEVTVVDIQENVVHQMIYKQV